MKDFLGNLCPLKTNSNMSPQKLTVGSDDANFPFKKKNGPLTFQGPLKTSRFVFLRDPQPGFLELPASGCRPFHRGASAGEGMFGGMMKVAPLLLDA